MCIYLYLILIVWTAFASGASVNLWCVAQHLFKETPESFSFFLTSTPLPLSQHREEKGEPMHLLVFFFFPFLISIMMLSHRDSLRSFNSPISWRQNVSHLMWSEPCADQSWCDSDGGTAGRIWPSEAHERGNDYEGHLFNESGSFIHSFSAIIATVYPVITLKACLQS